MLEITIKGASGEGKTVLRQRIEDLLSASAYQASWRVVKDDNGKTKIQHSQMDGVPTETIFVERRYITEEWK